MIAALLSKLGIPALILSFGVIAGIGVQQKVLNPKPERLDYSEIRSIVREVVDQELSKVPPPTVSVQPFDVEKIKNLRTFSYSPQFTGSIAVAGVDSVMIKRYVEESVMKAFEKHIVTKDKKKRK